MDAGIVVDLTKPTGPMAVADLRPATNLVVYCGMEDYAEALSTGASHWAIDEARAYYASMQEVPLVGRAAFFEQIPANDRDLYEVLVGGWVPPEAIVQVVIPRGTEVDLSVTESIKRFRAGKA